MTFGERLKQLRLEQGLSQAGLAEKAATSKQVISRYERGERVPKLTDARRLADALGVQTESLISGESEDVIAAVAREYDLTEDETALLGDFFALDPGERRRAFRLLKIHLGGE